MDYISNDIKMSLFYLVVKHEIYSIFSGGSSTNHTGFSDLGFYYTLQHVMELAGRMHVGTGALRDIMKNQNVQFHQNVIVMVLNKVVSCIETYL